MKKGLMVFVLAGLFLASCAVAPGEEISGEELMVLEEVIQDKEPGNRNHPQDTNLAGNGNLENVSGLTGEEVSGIVFMREEEKLARDVYLQLADLWGMNIFGNIAASEDTHMGAVLTLIEKAGVEDPTQGLNQGEFLNQDLQELYNDLVARGGESLTEALLVGAAIEEIDILDLQEYLAGTTDRTISEVYQNLLTGSINHLNAFIRTYERQTGEEYYPQYLSEQAFQELLTAASQGGGRQGRSDQPKGRGQSN